VRSVPSPSGCLRATSEFLFWGREGQRQMNRGRQCSEMQPNDNNRAGSVHGCTQTACLHAGLPYALSLRPIPQWATLEGCTAVALIRAWRRKTGKQAVCAHLWRADACAQGVPVARTAGGPYDYGSNGDSEEYARVQGIRRRHGTHQ